MTPRQVQRAVADAIAQEMPSMMDALAERLVSKLAPHLAPLFVIQGADAPKITMPPDHEAALRDAIAACPPAKPEAAPTSPWTVGEGSRRRLTEAGLARLAELLPKKNDAQIAAELGITRRAVETRRKTGTESTAAWAATPQPERDLARAEKNREYQREWYRKRRAKGATAGEAEPVVSGVEISAKPDVQADVPVSVADAQTVAVVPAAEVPAPRQPAVTMAVAELHAKIAEKRAALPAPAPPAPRPKAEPQVITTTPKEVRAWLTASLKAGGLSLVQAQDRVGFMTHDQALAEANQRRARAGYPPFAFLGARSAA